jgi:hypothetical protein
MESYQKNALVLLTDFGLKERFVGSMKGVAFGVDKNIRLFDLTHQIEPFNILEASETLAGTIPYWPEGTVFVAVIDPGVGTERKSIVVKTQSGHFIVTPDNGTLTHTAEQFGIEEAREIDETVNRLPHSEKSYTFHGRDVYVYTGARLASGTISFEEVGRVLQREVMQLPYSEAIQINENTVSGMIVKIEYPYGNVVTNIPRELLEQMGAKVENQGNIQVSIIHKGNVIYAQRLLYTYSFGYVKKGEAMVYPDSVQRIGLAVNGENFAKKYGIDAGKQWKITFSCS